GGGEERGVPLPAASLPGKAPAEPAFNGSRRLPAGREAGHGRRYRRLSELIVADCGLVCRVGFGRTGTPRPGGEDKARNPVFAVKGVAVAVGRRRIKGIDADRLASGVAEKAAMHDAGERRPAKGVALDVADEHDDDRLLVPPGPGDPEARLQRLGRAAAGQEGAAGGGGKDQRRDPGAR